MEQRPQTAKPFLAQLPARLLSQPGGAASAVVAHVDRAFPHYNGASQLPTYVELFGRLAGGGTVGWAMEVINDRYAELASLLHDLQERRDRRYGDAAEDQQLFDLWTATNDSRGFVVLGDPAARVRAGGSDGDGR